MQQLIGFMPVNCKTVSENQSGGGSDLHCRWPGLDLGGNDGSRTSGWSRETSAPKRPATSPRCWCFTIAALAVNRNILLCWNSTRSPIACTMRLSLRDAIFMSHCRSTCLPKLRAPARASSVARVSCRNRAITCESDRESQAGGRRSDAATRAAPDRSNRKGNRFWRPGAHAPSVSTRLWASPAGNSQRFAPTCRDLIALFLWPHSSVKY